MAYLKEFFILSLLAVGVFCQSSESSEEEGLFGGKLKDLFEDKLEDKPLLKMMLMRKLFGGEGGAGLGGGLLGGGPLGGGLLASRLLGGGELGEGPIARALQSGNTPAPLLRAMMLSRLAGGQGGQEQPSLLRALVLFRLMGERMGKKFIEAAKTAKEDSITHVFQTSLACDCAFEYIDEEGNMKGFVFDLVNAVCEEAGKKCKIIYDLSGNCYTHQIGEHSRAGVGLLAHYYDGCLGWMQTKEREHSVDFTKPFWHEGNSSHFYVKSGNPNGFDATNLAGKKIGLIDGFVTDRVCLKLNNKQVDLQSAVYADDFEILFQKLEDDEVDAIFMLEAYAHLHANLEVAGDNLQCGSGNFHVMTGEDSRCDCWFDEALDKMMESGKYYAVCQKARRDHGHKGEIKCMNP